MSGARALIVKTGSTVPSVLARRGDFEEWIAAGLGLPLGKLDVCEVARGEALPAPDAVAAVVVTGSPAFVSEREEWSVRSEAWVRAVIRAGRPVLGICYGHQLIAQALGGRVGPNPNGREIGTVEVDLSLARAGRDRLLGDLPTPVRLQATHLESVLALPDEAVLLATTPLDPHHAFRVGELVWGVQFHPEFDADVMRGYLAERADDLRAEGLDPEALSSAVQETPAGTAVLRRFAELFLQGEPA